MNSAPASSALAASHWSKGARSTEYDAVSSPSMASEEKSMVVVASGAMRLMRSRTILRSKGASASSSSVNTFLREWT